MSKPEYAYSAKPTSNPFRYALALWRFFRSKTGDDIIPEVAIIEIGFARSGFGRRLARWEETIEHLNKDPQTAQALKVQATSPPIMLDELERLPYGSLGQVFAEHCRNRGINPNLVQIPLEHESDWLLRHLFQSHDIWHVLTGWSNDDVGEAGLAGFYCGQMHSPAFFAFLYGIILLKAVLRKEDNIDELLAAFATGIHAGRKAAPLFGIAWEENWETPLVELRQRFAIDPHEAGEFGQGILAEAA